MPGVSPAPASAARSSSAGYGSVSGSPTFSPTSCAAAASTSRLSGRSSLPSYTGCSCPAPTGPARSGWPTMPSPVPTACSCITFTGRWHGWARRRLPSPTASLHPAASRTSSKSSCSSGAATCSVSCPSCSWTPRRCRSQARGGEALGAHGHSKDHRPDLKQMVLAVVLDGEGRPICTEMLPGNTADVTVLLPIVDRLRDRFAVGRVCVVADRGMISTATIRALEDRRLEYILGARERSSAVIREVVLNDEAPFTPLLIERARGETQLFVKEVKVDGTRYVVCRNEAEAEKDRSDRQAIVEGLEKQLRKGDKALIGNSAYRRYLRRMRNEDGPGGPAFEIDAGKLAERARYDGIFAARQR